MPPPSDATVVRSELIESNTIVSRAVNCENIVPIEPKNGIEKLLNVFPIQNSKFSFVLYPNILANGINIGLHLSLPQFFLILSISAYFLMTNIDTNPIIIINSTISHALLASHNSISAAIFLFTVNNQVLSIFSLFFYKNLD